MTTIVSKETEALVKPVTFSREKKILVEMFRFLKIVIFSVNPLAVL